MNDNNQGGVAVAEGQQQGQDNGRRAVEPIQLADKRALSLEISSLTTLVKKVEDGTKNILASIARGFETSDHRGVQAQVDQFTTYLNGEMVAYAKRLSAMNTPENRGVNLTYRTKTGANVQVNIGRAVQTVLPDKTRAELRAAIRDGTIVA